MGQLTVLNDSPANHLCQDKFMNIMTVENYSEGNHYPY